MENPRRTLCLLIASSGFATLSWEVIWQIKSTLALGVSAWGTAITLAVTMGGMCLGGLLMGHALAAGPPAKAVRLYGALELVIGLSGLALDAAFRAVERLDTWAYGGMPGIASLVHLLGIAAVLGVPTICMGATLPVFEALAKQFRVSIAELYGLNTLGASGGVLFAALLLIPWAGITGAIWAIAAINIAVGVSACLLKPGERAGAAEPPGKEGLAPRPVAFKELLIVAVTGWATFTLEIAWFRSLAATMPNTTDVFAIMLACMLLALGLAARDVPRLKRKGRSLGMQLSLAGIAILLATPLIERLDLISFFFKDSAPPGHFIGLLDPDTLSTTWAASLLYAFQTLVRFLATFWVLALPIRFLGTAFPWILDEQRSSRDIGRLYAANTLGAIAGALAAAWFLLPALGFAQTAWIAGALVAVTGNLLTPGPKRRVWAALGIAALLIAMLLETGVGRTRVQGDFAQMEGRPARVLDFFEGPESTVSVIEYDDGGRRLLIDSASASGESGPRYKLGEHYMAWMGHLPMLLQDDPADALVICFGTGQTANAVRKEDVGSLDIVDINPRIFAMARHFRSNEGVLEDPRVKTIVMDGRSYMRRSRKTYDVITLEPMPPISAGVNALYSKQFYELARGRLEAKGVIAQWLPLHSIAPRSAASIARTFTAVFPNAVLWIDPDSKIDGILLGTKDEDAALTSAWPGFARTSLARALSQEEVLRAVALDPEELARYGAYGEVISDDNQLLAYGKALHSYTDLIKENLELLHRIKSQAAQRR